MLVLIQRVGEVITISNGVTVTVLDIRGHRVQLGIKAPKSVIIKREELSFDRIDVAEYIGTSCESNRGSMVPDAKNGR